MPLTDPVPSSAFDVLERNIQDTDKFVNQETGTFTNRVGKVIKPIPVIEAEANAAVNTVITEINTVITEITSLGLQAIESIGWYPVGEFATGFTYTKLNDVGRDASGSWWRYNGSDLPKVINAGTVPSSPDFTLISFETADNVSKTGGGSVQDFIDSFALKIFQSPTNGGLTEIQTRTGNANEVYEVRKVSDDSLATIYSDAAGITVIVQNGTSNVSDSAGVVEFYIADGDYSVTVNTVSTTVNVSTHGQLMYRHSSSGSAVVNMLAGNPFRSRVGDYCNASGTIFRHNTGDGSVLSNYIVVGNIFADSFGADPTWSGGAAKDSWQAITDALEYAQSKLIANVILEGNYGVSKPVVVPASVWLTGGNINTTSITKFTNAKSGLPSITAYGGVLVMDVDACIIIGTGYKSGLFNMKIQTDAPVSCEYGIYHGVSRECNIENIRIGKSDVTNNGKYLFVNGITAEQGFMHSYSNISMYCKLRGWNYRYSQTFQGCNSVTCDRSYVVHTSQMACTFEGSSAVSLGNLYIEASSGGIWRQTGSANIVITNLNLDRHKLNRAHDGFYIRNSQLQILSLSLNAVGIADGEATNFISISNSGTIYTDLYMGGFTIKSAYRSLPNVTTINKFGDSEVFVRGGRYPAIGELGNDAQEYTNSKSALGDTGVVSNFYRRTVDNSSECRSNADRSSVRNSLKSVSDKISSEVVSSTFTKPGANYELCGGYAGSSGSLESASSANRKWSLDSTNGNIYGAGTVAGGHTFADFAEYFENSKKGVIPLGTLVDLDGDKVQPANGDEFIGVVSGTAGFVLNESKMSWQGRYLTGEYGEPIWELVDDADGGVVKVRKENPEYVPDREVVSVDENGDEILGEVLYLPRSERSREWSCIGLTGQVYVTVDPSVLDGDYLTAVDGIGVKSATRTCCRVMVKVSSTVAKCLIK